MAESSAPEINFSQMGIASVLKQYRLVVPPNQRDYSWTTKEVRTLFQDIAKAINDDDPVYFLGTIVTIGKSPDELEVTDGQQRLATTTILLATFRDYLRDKEPVLHESINNDFLTTIERKRRERVPHLTLNLDDNDYFRARLSDPPRIPMSEKTSHELINDAFTEARQRVREIVSGFDEKEHGDLINQWLDFLERRTKVILLIVNDEANAYRMFETLNDRGLKTSQADLIKNYLFGRAIERLPEVREKWAHMRGALETMEEGDMTIQFLRYSLTLIRGFVRKTEVYDAVQAHARAPQQVVSFTSNLESLSNSYVSIYNSDHEKWNEYTDITRKAIEVLNLFNIKPARPLMLAIAHRFIKRRELEEALTFCVSLCVRLMIVGGTRTGTVEVGLAKAGQKLYGGNINTVEDLKGYLKKITPTDTRFQNAFETVTIKSHKLARYYLRSLEMTAKGESSPWHIPNDDRNVINLEHILPEKPEGNWPQFSADEVKLYHRRIGNMVLLRAADNSALKSAGFDIKKPFFANSPYILTKQVADSKQWTIADINSRQKILAKYALQGWPI